MNKKITTIRTNPELWHKIEERVKMQNVQGTLSGQWSARKAQLAVKLYKQSGGGYKGKKSSSNSLVKWGKQKWRTRSGRNSSSTGERYLPSRAIKHLSRKEYDRTSRLKRRSMSRGIQFSRQPRDIARKTRLYRK
jgi:hypothetical protein